MRQTSHVNDSGMQVSSEAPAGLRLSLLDLAHNRLRRVPSSALLGAGSLGGLVLDGNMMARLETGDLANLTIGTISVSR